MSWLAFNATGLWSARPFNVMVYGVYLLAVRWNIITIFVKFSQDVWENVDFMVEIVCLYELFMYFCY